MIYLYESHTGGLYLSARDDLDTDYCLICGDYDSKIESYDIEDLEDGFSSDAWFELLGDLKRLYDDIDFAFPPTREAWEKSLEHHKRLLIDNLKEFTLRE